MSVSASTPPTATSLNQQLLPQLPIMMLTGTLAVAIVVGLASTPTVRHVVTPVSLVQPLPGHDLLPADAHTRTRRRQGPA